MAKDKSYGVDIQGSNGKVLRMGVDKPKVDRKDQAASWCVQFWIKPKDKREDKSPHSQFCIFVPPEQLRRGLENREYSGKSELSKDFKISIRGAGTARISVEGIYSTGSTGASTEVDANELQECLNDIFRRLDSD